MKITIKDSSGTTRDYSSYYDRTITPFNYSEVYDPKRGRTKTANLTLIRTDGSFVTPSEDQIVNVYRDEAGSDLIFGGVISKITPSVEVFDGSVWVRQLDMLLMGYDPKTLSYQEVVNYQRINIKAGQILTDLLNSYAPWIDTTNVQVGSSPVISSISIYRKKLADVIQMVIESTDWTFYVDDTAHAYFDLRTNLAMNWGLTEGTVGAYFPEFDFRSLKVTSNSDQILNDLTLLGGQQRGAQIIETFQWNGQDGAKSLTSIPFGLTSSVKFLDPHSDNLIDIAKWYENDPGNKITESSGRLQINSGVSNTGILVSKQFFSRDENVEVRFAEVEITSFAAGKLSVGVHNGTQATTITNFLHSLEFDQSSGNLRTREGATVTTFGGIPIGVGIYSVRIRVKSTGGAIYYIQGGRTATPIEYGKMGSKTWTKVTETSLDTTAGLAIGIYCDNVLGATVIGTKASNEIDVQVLAKSGTLLGTTTLAADTYLVCGLESALDFETDCYVGTGPNNNPTINFFTDNKPLGTIIVTYYQIDSIRERVADSTAKTAADGRSALTGDDGTRRSTINRTDLIANSQDARNVLVSLLKDQSNIHYQGSFNTTYLYLKDLIPAGNRPIAGKQITFTLPNTFGLTATEIITNVTASDLGGENVGYGIQFGIGNLEFDRLLLKLRQTALIEITDDPSAAVDVDSEDSATAGTARVASPTFLSALFDGTGVAIAWNAVAGASTYEVRDNLYKGQGQGGSLVYQKNGSTSYSIAPATINSSHKKRSFNFYVWAVTAGGQYSKYPTIITVEDPAPVPQPIRDLTNPNGLTISMRFAPEVEADILASGRRVQISTTRDMTSLVINTDILKTVENYDFAGSANTVYYLRYGLTDDYTVSLADRLFSGIREIKTGSADFSGSTQFLNNTPPDNATTNLAITSVINNTGDSIVTYTFDYTQGANIATHFALVFKIGGGTPSINDPSILVPSRGGSGQTYKLQLPSGTTTSMAVIPVAVTKGGSTAIGSYQTVTGHVVGGSSVDSKYDAAGNSGNLLFGSRYTTNRCKFYTQQQDYLDTLSAVVASINYAAGHWQISASNGVWMLNDLHLDKATAIIEGTTSTLELRAATDLKLNANNIYSFGDNLPNSTGVQNCGNSTKQWAEVRGTVLYQNGTSLALLFGRLGNTNSWSGVNNFSNSVDITAGKLYLKGYASLANFKAGITAGETATYVDGGVINLGYFDGANYFGWASLVV